MALCKFCERSITWADGPSGRPMAFDDPEPTVLGKTPRTVPGADWVIVAGKARHATAEDRKLHRQMLVCHFDVCEK